jgi:glycosyltransferase involved in cell wall biosynthesis
MKYVLITPARNEEAFIERTLNSVIAQARLPERWVIVDDGSTDRTAEIVRSYAKRFPWIDIVQRQQRRERSFADKVHAFNAGLERVQSFPFEVIGNLDADLSFDLDYLEFLMRKFSIDAKLGVAGTPFTEDDGYDSARDSFEGGNHVAGGCQLFRRQCFEDVGGYIPNPAGGVDWIAVTTARMKGWKTRSFPEKRFHHYRTLGTAGKSSWAASFSYGEKDYYLGGSPLWQLFRVAYRTTKQPIEGVALLTGYCWAAIRRVERPVSRELMRFHRREQTNKLRAIFGSLLRLKKIDNFSLLTERNRAKGSRTREKTMRLTDGVSGVLTNFVGWLDAYGETSRDHQTFFAGTTGKTAKALYYHNKLLGTAAVAPMIFFEALLPSARRLFHYPIRFPIADAHYAMGFAFLFRITSDDGHLQRAIHFLEELKKSRSPGFKEYCWGYPFDWVTRNGTIKNGTPLITTTPYCYEAFLQVTEILESEVRGQRTEDGPDSLGEYNEILESIARHAFRDIKDFPTSENSSSCSYTPFDTGGVINAAAYRAFLLTSASQIFSQEEYWLTAERNLNFVLKAQNPDGSWYYAVDGVRDFVDHYHTCFVMKALAKIHALTGHPLTLEALRKGVRYYLNNLFDTDGLPKPFSRAPRLTVYKRELYDCAECINLCLLLRDRFPELEATLDTVVAGILKDWIKPDGSFRSRRLRLGWDNVPMHRWGQSQMFRSLAFYLWEAKKTERPAAESLEGNAVESGLVTISES